MNKKISRIAAIALTAAMVSSAFAMSTATSFAAALRPAETVAATVSMQQSKATIVKVNNSGTAFALPIKGDFDLKNAKVDGTTKDLSSLTGFTITNVKKSGSSVDYDSTKLTAPLTAKTTGDTTFTYSIKGSDTTNNKDYVADVTSVVRVLPSNALVVTPSTTDENAAGEDLSGVFNITTGDAGTVKLVTLGANTAKYESLQATQYKAAAPTYTWSSDAASVQVAKDSTNYEADYQAIAAGTANISATVTGDDNRQIQPLAVTVKDSTTISASASTAVTIAPDRFDASKTYITSTDASGKTTDTVTKTDVTNKDVILDATNMTGLTIADGAKVGNITIKNAPSTFTALTVNGTVGNITFDKDTSANSVPVTKIGTGAVTGTIDLSNVAAPGATTVTLTDDEAKDISVAGIKLPAGKAVAITNDTSKANKVTLNSVTADTVTVTGRAANATKATGVDGKVSDYSQVAIGNLSATDATLTHGVTLTAKDVALNVANSNKFLVLATGSGDTASDVTVGNKVAVTALTSTSVKDTFNFTAGADITVATTVADTATVVAAPVNALRIGSVATGGIAVKLLGSFKAGDTWVTTDAVANVNLTGTYANLKIAPANFDSADDAKATADGYAYLVSGKTVTGVAMDKTAVTLGLNDTDTLTVSNQPAGAADYAKYEVKWSTSNPDFVTVVGSGKTATIKAVKYADLKAQAADNTATVTATYVAYDNKGLPYNIGQASANVTVVPAIAAKLTTTVTDVDGKEIPVTGETVIKMTQSTSNTVSFAADKAGITDIKYVTGNDKVAQTGTVSAWNGTTGTYNVYANGKVGDKVGVFANGVRVFQIEIVDRPFTCDTTVDFQMKAGKTYTFKITPAAGTKINTFDYRTANGKAIGSWKGTGINADGTVTRTIKAFQSTNGQKVGVYATINGVTYKVFAVEVTK